MPIVVNLDVMLARRKMSLTELSERVDITLANLSILKSGKAFAWHSGASPATFWNTSKMKPTTGSCPKKRYHSQPYP
jgi:hypothetical protein